MTTCTLATIAHFLGYTPAPGATIVVQSAWLQGYSASEISHAKACLRRHGLRYRIVGH